ncbi:NAD-dependent epimerase/dehydratase family protein [Desertivirga xinjiangensis]|uniref:NAD-dependent epimerase/dehydratase family protein n=1 Tax=Desertivirga xinjiangensis TaxID=539206 RepID=UPI00210B28E7|nr:NAD-dependent epimerase/dehydratase family protein [Pedobacter xinjiangensis]
MIHISGMSGFVGDNLDRYLRARNIYAKRISRGELGCITSSQISGSVIHLAGKAHDLKKTSAPEQYYAVNTDLTKSIYSAFLESTATKFIFISSVKAVADSIEGKLKEDNFPFPKTDYGKSKLLAEQYIQSQDLPEGKSFYILRPCMIHGPNNKGNLNLLYNFISKGFPYPLVAFENRRSFLCVENLCFVIREILERDDIPSGVYNVADDDPLSTTEVVQLLSHSLEKKPRLLNLSPGLIRTMARIGDFLRLPLNSEKLQKLTENYMVDNSKIKTVLKKELPLSAREGILKTALSFKNA